MQTKKGFALAITAALLFCLLSGCASSAPNDKTVVTMTNDSNMYFSRLEELVETVYPDIDLQLETFPAETFTSETERRLKNGAASDLVIMNQPSGASLKSYMLDLSGYAFCSEYEKVIMDNLLMDGKAYLIPMTGFYQGYHYNKTLFEQHGIPVPTNNSELEQAILALTAAGIDNGYGSALGIKNHSMSIWGGYVIGYGVPDFLSTPQGIQWFADFCDGKGTFVGTWNPIFEKLAELGEKNIIAPDAIDWQRNAVPLQNNMAQGKSALAFYPGLSLERLAQANKAAYDAGTAPALYEYGILPFMSDGDRSGWTITTPQCYIGINAHAANPGNEKKLDACERVLELISTNDGQAAITFAIGNGISYLRGCNLGENNAPAGLEQVVAEGFVYTVKLPGRAADAVGTAFCALIAGKLTPAECAAAIDKYYYQGSPEDEYAFSVVGSVSADLLQHNYNVRTEETELGNLVADSIRQLSGAQIAVANGGGIRSSLYKGDVTGADLLAICPYDNKIVVLSLSGQTIRQMLENGLSAIESVDGIPGGRFLQISGAAYTFDSARPSGQRLLSVTLPDGSALEDGGRYAVAVNDYMAGAKGYSLNNGDGFTMLNVYSDDVEKSHDAEIIMETEKTYRDAITEYFSSHSDAPVVPRLDGRIVDVDQ